ncbi:MAG: hypothetical protein ACJAZS_000224 [Alteromonas naphthalenivorans]|jgi:hypothetical protein
MKKSIYNIAHSSPQNEQTNSSLLNRLNQKFVSAVKWNMAETIAYHTLFITHQLSLFSAIGPELYGKAGALFSFVFLSVTLLIGALDIALIPYIQIFTASKQNFKFLIFHYLAPQIILMLSAPLLLWIFKATGLVTRLDDYSWSSCLLVGIFIAGQSIHKLLRRLLQLMFLNKYTAGIEVATLIMYMTLFWSAYFLGYTFSIPLIVFPYVVASFITVTCFILLIKKHAQELPTTSNIPMHIHNFRTIQLCGIINQITRSVFSSNFLIPLFALHAGFKQAGIATLINYGAYTMTFFVQKICAPAAALFGNGQHLTETQKQNHFSKSLQLFFSIILFLTLTFGLYGWTNILYLSNTTLLYACFFFLVHTLEHLFTLYEKFFAAQHKALTLTLCNVLSCVTSGYAFYILHTSHFLTAILVSFVARALLFVILSFVIFSSKTRSFLWFFKKQHSKSAI